MSGAATASETVAVAETVVSATLVAVTVTFWAALTEAGAVYSPLVEMLPADGLIDHVTAVFVAFETVAVNCCVPVAFSVTVAGLIVIVAFTGTVSEIVAVPVELAFAVLVAVTVTLCAVLTVAGAVYRPAELMLPTAGLIDQVTAVFEVPETVAVNVCVPAAPSDTDGGVTVTVGEGVDPEFWLPPHPINTTEMTANRLWRRVDKFMAILL